MTSLIDTVTQVSPIPAAPTVKAKNSRPLTAGDIIEQLPADATPAQQDSAVRANITPEPITHWSKCPDTLHLPGHSKGKTLKDFSIPHLYYTESFFSTDSMFHPEVAGRSQGVSGDPVPYTVAGDSWVSSVLILCFILASLAISRSRQLIAQQVKRFFPTGSSEKLTLNETSEEFRYQLFFVVVTCLMLGIGYFLYSQGSGPATYVLPEYWVMGICVAIVMAYFLLKFSLFAIVNSVFFDRRDNEQWLKSYLFLVALEGALLFPVIMLVAYFSLPMRIAGVCVAFILIFIKILSIYKCKTIFFKKTGVFLQIFLYFCALEVIPLLALAGSLSMVSQYLRINF